jgi:hypothetical protein
MQHYTSGWQWGVAGGHFWHDWSVETLITPAMTNVSIACRTMDRWNVVQHELIPELEAHWGPLTPKLERVIHILEWVRIEEFTAIERGVAWGVRR